jgi:hypothetical protein
LYVEGIELKTTSDPFGVAVAIDSKEPMEIFPGTCEAIVPKIGMGLF